jgi:hypothetical protein
MRFKWLIIILVLGILACFTLIGKRLSAKSTNSLYVAHVELRPRVLAFLHEGTCQLNVVHSGQVIGKATLLQSGVEFPIALIPLKKEGSFFLLFDFDTEDVVSVIDCSVSNDGQEKNNTNLKVIYKSSSFQIRDPKLAEIDEAMACFSQLSPSDQRRAIGDKLASRATLESVTNLISIEREYYRPGGWRRGR